MVARMFSPSDYLDLKHTEHRQLFETIEQCWEVLPQITTYLKFRLKPGFQGHLLGRPFISSQVFIGRGTVVEQGAVIKGPAWIGENCEIRAGCYIRENVLVGDGCVLGNSSEFKNCILFDEVQAPHFNYVGDSVLGYKAHLGAGVILSNVKLDRTPVGVLTEGGIHTTGLRKFGAVVGDESEIGCNSVLSPGSIIGRNCILYPGVQWKGHLPHDHIAKLRQSQQTVLRKHPRELV